MPQPRIIEARVEHAHRDRPWCPGSRQAEWLIRPITEARQRPAGPFGGYQVSGSDVRRPLQVDRGSGNHHSGQAAAEG